jgi:hypothetical protein
MAYRTHWALAALVALSGAFAIDALHAQQAGTESASPFEPIEAPKLSPDAFKPPQPAANVDAANFDKSNKETPGIKLPNRIDLGNYDLEFKAGVGGPDTRKGLDSGETSNLPAQKETPPGYFGLKLTAPTK